MDSLFEEDGSDSSLEKSEAEVLQQTEGQDSLSRLSSNLRRYGAVKRLSHDILEPLLEKLTHQPLKLLRIAESLEVDEYLWNFTVIQLQNDDYSGNILDKIRAWPLYREKKLLPQYNKVNIREIHIYNATKDIPTIVYCANKKKLSREFTPSVVEHVSEIRYQLVLEKTKVTNNGVLPVDAVSRNSKEEQVIIGIIGLNKKGDLCLQGSLAELPMVIDDDTIIRNAIYCDRNIVIVRGLIEPYKNNINCIEISQPPIHVEMPLPDFFGGRLTLNDQRELEGIMSRKVEAKESEQWIIISDVHLDKDTTIKSLETLFSTFLSLYQNQGFPVGFILMGNFMSSAFATVKQPYERYNKGFEALYRFLATPKFRVLLMSCYFVLVPGTGDAALCNQLLPMQPLIGKFTASIKERMDTLLGHGSKFMSMTNPCRIRHLCRRMIFCRNDLLKRLLSASIINRSSDNKMTSPAELKEMLMATVLGQGHLIPSKPGTHTVLKHDAALLLYPSPDLICIGDNSCPPFITNTGSIVFCNVESFSMSRSFVSYDAISGKCHKLAL